MSPRTILTIEDDPAIRRGIVDALAYAGYRVLQAGTVTHGRQQALNETYSLLLLDIVLPDGNGLDLLADLRESRATQPVILLTARGDESDRVRGLKMGADDYVVKPFSVKELMARIEAVLRRSPEPMSDLQPLEIPGKGIVDFAAAEFRRDDGTRCELSPREVQLVTYLVRHAGRAVSREEILQQVWGIDSRGVTTRTIDMHVARLREKLRDSGEAPETIVTVRGRGYLWREPATASPKNETV